VPCIAYRAQRFNGKARKTVEQAKLILSDLVGQGYTPTLRQLYYQFVRRNWIANKEQEYKRLGRIVCDAREVGEIDWLWIEDRGRGVARIDECPTWERALQGLEHGLLLDPWKDQDVYVEVAVEKDALVGVVGRPASRWRAPYMACKGYLSASEAWRMGLRFQKAIHEGKRPVLLHLGDHDPSGLHMTVDNRTRLELFARHGVEVNRLALNRDQVDKYECPPNPAKMTDTRAAGYVAEHGRSSWELDALPPKALDDLIADTLESYIDKEKWKKTLEREAEMREPLSRFAHRWEELIELVRMDEKPLERLKIMDSLMAEVPELARRAGGRLMAQGLAVGAACRTQIAGEVKEVLPPTVAVDQVFKDVKEPDRATGYVNAKLEELRGDIVATVESSRDIPPFQEDKDLRDELEQTAEAIETVERTPFELPEGHTVPTAEMPWDIVEEEEDLPEGYTTEEDDDDLTEPEED
jgi:hypothetical protein